MKFIPILMAAGLAIAAARSAADSPRPGAAELSFRKHCLDRAFRSEGVAVADFNRDGTLDIACGGVYYAGPDWRMHPMMHAMPKEFNPQAYSDAFLCFAEDVNKDSWPDLIVVGFPGKETVWLENPKGAGGVWKKHMAVGATGNESPCWTDVDGDGSSELVFMAGNRCSFAAPDDDPTFPWLVRAIAKAGDPGAGHGLGVGDVNGDGFNDVLIPAGWWEGPKDASTSPWQFHAAKLAGSCAQICVYDCDGDGDNDVLSSSAHEYGIWWAENTPGGWVTHEIDKSFSQAHALHLADINGDGLQDFVTGKRYLAHTYDPGAGEPSVLCWFELRREGGRPAWTRHEIDNDSGVGLHAVVIDMNGDGLLDIVASNKKGVHIFIQERGAKEGE